MSILSKIFSLGAGDLANAVGNVADKFNFSGEEKANFKLEMEKLLQKRDSEIEQTIRTELEAKERVLVAELSQGDNYTKRARPTVVYMGLLMALINYVIIPNVVLFLGAIIQPFPLPEVFWYGWSGIVTTWSIGRTMEKRGARGRLTSMITGSKLLDG